MVAALLALLGIVAAEAAADQACGAQALQGGWALLQRAADLQQRRHLVVGGPAGDWERLADTNCYDGFGGSPVEGKWPLPGSPSLEDCKDACEAEALCEGIITHGDGASHCWLIRDVEPSKCFHPYPPYVLWHLRRDASSAPASPTTAQPQPEQPATTQPQPEQPATTQPQPEQSTTTETAGGRQLRVSILTASPDGRAVSVLQVEGAQAVETAGGPATSARRTVYMFTPDGTGGAATYTGAKWPIVYVPEGATIDIAPGVPMCIGQAADRTLLVDGKPAYQFMSDTDVDAANGNTLGGVWFWFEASTQPAVTTQPPQPLSTTRPAVTTQPPQPLSTTQPAVTTQPPQPSSTMQPATTQSSDPATTSPNSPGASPSPPPRSGECPTMADACSAPVGQVDWTITQSCAIQAGSYPFRKVVISGGAVVSVQQGADVSMDLTGGLLIGAGSELWIGCEGEPFTGSWTLTFKGRREDLKNQERWLSVNYADYGLPQRSETWANALVAAHGSRLEVHGLPKTSWTRLSADAQQGAKELEVADAPTGWLPGDEIIIAQTGRNTGGAERATITSVSGSTVVLQDGLAFAHDGSWPGRGQPLNAEVGMISRNIRFTSDVDFEGCERAFGGKIWGQFNDVTKSACFGGNIAFLQHAVVHIENAEFDKLGQALTMGRYALHFHLAGDVSGSYLRDNSIQRSSNRCMVLHGAFNAALEGNVCLDNRGHNIYLEDGIEWGNAVVRNLVVNPTSSATICTDDHDGMGGAAGLWITNPNNTFTDNAVSGAAFGAWFTFPTESAHPFTGGERGRMGGIFGASAGYFRDPASGFGPDSWVVRQEQARTPAAAFHRNAFKGSSKQGIAIDFRVYDSEDAAIPCLEKSAYTETSCPTCASVGHTFAWGPAAFDVGLPPEQRTYEPAKNAFEDIVIAYTHSLYFESFSFWATGGLVSFERSVFVDNQQGSSLGFAGECAGGAVFGVGGVNAQFSNSLFLKGAPPFKLYDGGYHCQDCRWAELDHLVKTRQGSPGNVNGLIMERSAPLGWVASDRGSDLFGWVWESGRVELDAVGGQLPSLIDWSDSFSQNTWQSKSVSVVSADGLAGTVRGGAFTQWIPSGDVNNNQGWGFGAMVNDPPAFRQFYPCLANGWCGDGRDCSPHRDGADWANAPWLR